MARVPGALVAVWLAAMVAGSGAAGANQPAPPTGDASPVVTQAGTAMAPAVPAVVEEPPAIADNSFLLEEAYNQEPGVIQHISAFQRDTRTGAWVYTFTQEWPAPGQRHQLSATFAGLRMDGSPDGGAGVGDIGLNYRYQLVDKGPLAVSPRFSIYLPTGNSRQGRGAGGVGYQVNLPVSVQLTPKWVTHINAGATIIPGAVTADDEAARTWGLNLGQSVIWLLHPRFNAMLEVVYNRTTVKTGGVSESSDAVWVNPGIRWAFNFKSGLQIVPGLAFPIGVGPSSGNRAVFLYLSFEHPMWKPKPKM